MREINSCQLQLCRVLLPKFVCYYRDELTNLPENPSYRPLSPSSPVLMSLHWFRINERIQCKLISLTYEVLTTNQPQYLHNLISVQPCHNTRSTSMVTLARPSTRCTLKITNHSFQISVRCILSLESTPHRTSRAPSDTVSFTFTSYHT